MKYFFLTFIIGSTFFYPTQNYHLENNSKLNKFCKNDIKTFGRDYFPLELKKHLIYSSSFGDLDLKISKENNVHLFSYDSDKFKYRQKLFISDKGLFVNETYQKIKLLLFITKEGNYVYEKPLLRIPFPIEIGQEWTWSGNEFVNDEIRSVSVKGKASNFEKINTPAGSFDALKVETTLETSSGSKNVLTEWYAKDLGMIKMNISIEGGGILGFARDILGYGTIEIELKEILDL